MDALWTLLAVAATGVTYDWQPLGDGADGVEYIVRVEPELLESARAGKLEAIESNVPPGLGPIRRIRVVLDGRKGYRVGKPVAEEPSAAASPTAKRHTVRQTTTTGQPLTPFTQGINTAAGQLEQGFQQASQGVQGGFQQAGNAAANAQPAFTQPFVAQAPATTGPQRTIGSELLRGAGELRDGVGNVIRNTGEAIQGTTQNLGNGLRSVLTGGERAAQPIAGQPVAPTAGSYNPYAYNNGAQPAATAPVFNSTTTPANGGFSAPGFSTTAQPSAATSGFSSTTGTGLTTQPLNTQGTSAANGFSTASGFNNPSNLQAPSQNFAGQPAPTQGFNQPNAFGNPGFVDNRPPLSAPGLPPLNQPTATPSPFASNPLGTAATTSSPFEQPGPVTNNATGFAQQSADQLTNDAGLVRVRPARVFGSGVSAEIGNLGQSANGAGFSDWQTSGDATGGDFGFGNSGFGNTGFGNTGFGNTGSTSQGFAGGPVLNAPLGSNPTGGTASPAWPNQSGQLVNRPTGDGLNTAPGFGANPSGTTPGSLAPLGQPGAGQQNPAMQTGAYPPGYNNANQAGYQQTPINQAAVAGKQPWQWVASILLSFGSVAANFFLGWSYLDARSKYQSALRRTVRTFTRGEA